VLTSSFLVSIIMWGMTLIFLGGVATAVTTYVDVDQQFYLAWALGLTASGAGVLAIAYGSILSLLRKRP
jgi:hypothetical protein